MLIKQLSYHKSDLIYVVSSSVAPFISMVCSVITSRYVEPKDMGYISGVLLVMSYLGLLQVGVFNGLNRDIAYYKAKDPSKVQSFVDTSFVVALVVSAVTTLGSLIYLGYCIIVCPSTLTIMTAVALTVICSLSFFSNHYDVTFRSSNEFKTLGIIRFKESGWAVVMLLLPYLFSYVGHLIRQMMTYAIQVFYRFKHRPYKFKRQFSKECLWILIKDGFPIMFMGYVFTILNVADKTFIAANFPAEQLGYYSIAGLCSTGMMAIPSAINSLLYPKAAYRYGETGDKRVLLGFWKKALLLYVAILIPLVAVAYWIIPYFVEFLMPKYTPGIAAARISILTALAYIYMGVSVIFGTLKKNILNTIVVSSMLALFWIVTMVFRDSFTTIESVAWLRMAMFGVIMIFTIISTYIFITSKK